MPLHKEVPSLWNIAAKKVSKLVLDSVTYISKKYGLYERQTCVEKALELQQLLFHNCRNSVHKVNKEIEIDAQHHALATTASCKILLAVLIRRDMEVFDNILSVPMHSAMRVECTARVPYSYTSTMVQIYLFGDITFWKSRLEQCYRLVELDVTGLSPEFVANCDYLREISNNCKHTLEIVKIPIHSREEAMQLFYNLQECKELTSVSFLGNVVQHNVIDSKYAMGVKMFVESLPKLSTFFFPCMRFVLEMYEKLHMVGFSSTSLTGFGKFSFSQDSIMLCNLLSKLFDLCPNIEQISVCAIPLIRPVREHAQNYDDSDALLMTCLNSKALHLQSLSVILLSDNLSYNITQLTSIGGNLRLLELDVYGMTPSDVFVLGQVCKNLERLYLNVRKYTPPKNTFSLESMMDDVGTCVIFTKLTSLSIILNNFDFMFFSHVDEEQFSMDKNILFPILKNARKLEKFELQLDSSFGSIFHVIIPFFQDGTLQNLKHFAYRWFNLKCLFDEDLLLTKDTIRLILDKCPKLSFLKLLAHKTDDANAFIKEYSNQLNSNNLDLEIKVKEYVGKYADSYAELTSHI